MVPAPSCPFTWDYWTSSSSEFVELTCLMPNSIYIPLSLSWDATLLDVKVELWYRAARYPLFGVLHQMSNYMFQFINSLAAPEEVDDENKRLGDIKPVCGVLILIEKSKERPEEHLLNTQISNLIGKGLNEFDILQCSEVNDFRTHMRVIAEDSFIKRAKSNRHERLMYQCPPRLADQPDVPTTLQTQMKNHRFIIVTYTKANEIELSYTLRVTDTQTPSKLIETILQKKSNSLNKPVEHHKNYVLKVCGREEYLIGEHPLIQFLYIQETLSRDGVPQVMAVSVEAIAYLINRETHHFCLPEKSRISNDHMNTIRNKAHQSSWSIDQNYSCTIQKVTGLNVDYIPIEVICYAGIYHGNKSLCEHQKTMAVPVTAKGVAEWNERLEFPIKVVNMPRMARLCLVIYEIKRIKGRKRKDCINKLTWSNTMVFDYKEQLRKDAVTLYMWTPVADEPQGDDVLLHPLGTVVSNPNPDSCAALQVRFSDYDYQHAILFPLPHVVRAYADQIENSTPDVMARLSRDFKQLRAAAEKDPMYEMHEQERKDIWASREYFRVTAPQLLPKLVSCVEWSDRAEAASVQRMVSNWPKLPVEQALELLDYAYADAAVRSFAVKCLAEISDQDLLLYLLQLVQALKHEPYLRCDLVEFLLKRAFCNMTIGHYLFWHLRSEMHVPYVSVRFGLLLEAYCRGCQDHINILMRQKTCIEKLRWMALSVKSQKDIAKARQTLKQHLAEQHCLEAVCDFVSPLNPSFICGKIDPEKCQVMDSKKRPLLLEFKNADKSGSDIRIILKEGDDLRQDMFTLQMLRIMDRLWKNAGYDFKLYPYNCISMENAMGMIEVVEESKTVANIQKQGVRFSATSTICKTQLYQWLRERNPTETAFNKAVEEFTLSCAGYSVATYVLGIGDRHPDNIMLRENGQLFHIDFGHFLGHWKHKFGFKRERVPFVLTHDFIHVINRGQKGSGTNEPLEFTIFREHCEKAFKILREHGHLILSLFSMMISTGLKELSSEKNLQYLRDTLVLDLSEDKAIEHFRSKFTEAMRNAWTTSLDWAIHNLDKNNRQ